MGGGHDERLVVLNDARWKHGPCGGDILKVTMILNTVTPIKQKNNVPRRSAKTHSAMVQAIVDAIVDLPVLAGPKSVEPEVQRLRNLFG